MCTLYLTMMKIKKDQGILTSQLYLLYLSNLAFWQKYLLFMFRISAPECNKDLVLASSHFVCIMRTKLIWKANISLALLLRVLLEDNLRKTSHPIHSIPSNNPTHSSEWTKNASSGIRTTSNELIWAKRNQDGPRQIDKKTEKDRKKLIRIEITHSRSFGFTLVFVKLAWLFCKQNAGSKQAWVWVEVWPGGWHKRCFTRSPGFFLVTFPKM